jgi:TRAP transporter 4TM/12TM fusion protein
MTRRGVNIAVTLVGVAGLLYGYFGPYMPGMLRHAGIDISRIAGYLYTTLDGIFGVALGTMAEYIFLIITFGAFLKKSGTAKFIMDLSLSLVGHRKGGPAYTAIVASSLFAMISGSSQANVAATGVITIPMMKEVGYKPHNAAAIEVGASLGGPLCPPIMATAAFLMSGFTGIPYVTIALASILPIILYYTGVIFFIIYATEKNRDVKIVPRKELPNVKQVLQKGWHLLIPLVVIFFVIFSGYSPTRAGMLGIVSVILVSYFRKELRMSIKSILDAFSIGAIASLKITCAAACIGILVGTVGLSGLGIKFSHLLVALAGGRMWLLIILVGLASVVTGMGMPISAAYIVVSILAVPALQLIGIPVLAAHFIVLYFAQSAAVTPPVCLTTYVAAGLADANFFKTAMSALRIVKGLFIIPFLIAYTSLISGTWGERFMTFVFCFIGMIALTTFMERYMLSKLHIWEVVGTGFASILLFTNFSLLLRLVGFGIFLGVFLHQRLTFRVSKVPKSNENHKLSYQSSKERTKRG